MSLVNALVELYKRASCELPRDVVKALKCKEKKGSNAEFALKCVLKNVKLAADRSRPLCQDTGLPTFYVYYPKKYSQKFLVKSIREATKIAFRKGYLRKNAVSFDGKCNSVGVGIPKINFYEAEKLRVTLLLKGGGSENVSCQYKLPNSLGGRDLDGVKKCIIDCVKKASGMGCAPGIIGVGVGGDRASSYEIAKMQLLKKLGKNSKLEKELFRELNGLGIGPMGFGGKNTVLGVKVGFLSRLPACYFVSVAYMCWCCRRKTLEYNKGKVIFS